MHLRFWFIYTIGESDSAAIAASNQTWFMHNDLFDRWEI